MVYQLATDAHLGAEVRRVALECLDDALERLASFDRDDAAATTEAIHEARKRCKELRGLVRLTRPALGREYRLVNDLARDAAKQLAPLRDAHARLATVESLQAGVGEKRARRLDAVRDRQSVLAATSDETLPTVDERVERAGHLLVACREIVTGWTLDDDVDPLDAGIRRTYRRARSELERARRRPSDERLHRLRKSVKYLWYQVRLLEAGDPEALTPLAEDLHRLSDLLGDDHDLAVLVGHVTADLAAGPDPLDEKTRRRTIRTARARQESIRDEALSLGAKLLDERPRRFVERTVGPWHQLCDLRRVEGSVHSHIERERSFLVATLPELPDAGSPIRQGYLALDREVQVRVREVAGTRRTLTVKGGHGAVRTEMEWRVGPERFSDLWPFTRGRRTTKVRHRVPLDGFVAEVDVYSGDLEGLVLVEVEFDSEEAMGAFDPPGWFGIEVTDDERYTDAVLATEGLPDDDRRTV